MLTVYVNITVSVSLLLLVLYVIFAIFKNETGKQRIKDTAFILLIPHSIIATFIKGKVDYIILRRIKDNIELNKYLTYKIIERHRDESNLTKDVS